MKNLIKPCAGPITSPFGNRTHPFTGAVSFHNGLDIAAPVGTPVYAPASGKVTQLWDHASGGLCLAFVSPDGTRFGFAHLDSWAVKVGDQVQAGDIIARSGNTGRSTGPHLHFTMKINNAWVDPQQHIDFS